jgi:hypothetical protein
VSAQGSNSLFVGYGVKKINMADYRFQYIPLHKKQIRDMDIDKSDTLLTCGMDKKLILTNIVSNMNVHCYECTHPVWSCVYDKDEPFFFYAGLGSGQVLKFDKRKTDTFSQILTDGVNTPGPIFSLQFIPKDTNDPSSPAGLLVAQSDKISFYEKKPNNEYKYHMLLIEKQIMSCFYETNSKHILVSTRPNEKNPYTRQLVFELSKATSDPESDSNLRLNRIIEYKGTNIQKLLARSKLFMFNSELYGCSSCEKSNSVSIWNVSSNKQCDKLVNTSAVIDVLPLKFKQKNYICSLTEKQLKIFKQR